MAVEETRRIVPRGDLQGSLGSGEKRWEKAYIGNVGNTYDSVSDMVADLELMEGSTVETKGYYVAGDGGNSSYHIREKSVSDVDDGGSIIFLNNGNVAELVNNGVISVKQFGVRGNGVVDDSSAFNKAVSYASNEGLLIIPNETYNIDNPVISDSKNVVDNGNYVKFHPVFENDEILIKEAGNVQLAGTVNYTEVNTGSQQGSTYNTKTGKIILALIDATPGTQKLVIVNPETYVIETGYNYTQLGHANSVEYCPEDNKIYVLNENNAVVIDGDTMQIVDTIALPFSNCFGLKYDSVGGEWVLLSGSGSVVTIRCLDTSFNLIHSATLTLPDTQVYNSFAVHNGNIMLPTWTHIIALDVWGNLRNYIPFNGTELEDGFYIDDELFFSANNYWTPIYKIAKTNEGQWAEKPFKTLRTAVNEDLNNFVTTVGCYAVRTDSGYIQTNHFPSNVTAGILVVYLHDSNFVKQVFYRESNASSDTCQIYARSGWYINAAGDMEWSNWERVDSKPTFYAASNFSSAVGTPVNSNSYILNKTATLNIKLTDVNISTSGVILTVPVEFRPINEASVLVFKSNGTVLQAWIRPSGEIYEQAGALSNESLRIMATYATETN